MSHLNFLD